MSGKIVPNPPCCDAFGQAFECGTDNEAWGSLMRHDGDGDLSIGCGLPPIKYCPWCGRPVSNILGWDLR